MTSNRRQTIIETTTTVIALALAVLVLLVLTAGIAGAATDLGNGQCRQTDGALGVFNGTTADDAGCITPAEYEALYSVANLIEVGVITEAVDNGDGTTTITVNGGTTTIVTEPLDRPVSSNPGWEPDAPTVRRVLYSHVFYPV